MWGSFSTSQLDTHSTGWGGREDSGQKQMNQDMKTGHGSYPRHRLPEWAEDCHGGPAEVKENQFITSVDHPFPAYKRGGEAEGRDGWRLEGDSFEECCAGVGEPWPGGGFHSDPGSRAALGMTPLHLEDPKTGWSCRVGPLSGKHCIPECFGAGGVPTCRPHTMRELAWSQLTSCPPGATQRLERPGQTGTRDGATSLGLREGWLTLALAKRLRWEIQ